MHRARRSRRGGAAARQVACGEPRARPANRSRGGSGSRYPRTSADALPVSPSAQHRGGRDPPPIALRSGRSTLPARRAAEARVPARAFERVERLGDAATTATSSLLSSRTDCAFRARCRRSSAIAAWPRTARADPSRRREPRVAGPVEHLEHAERPLLVQQRDGHQALGHVAGRSAAPRANRGSLLTSSITSGWRLDEDPAGDAGARREAQTRRASPRPRRRPPRRQLVGLLVEEEDRRRLGAEDRPGRLDDRAQQRRGASPPRRARPLRPPPAAPGRSSGHLHVRRDQPEHGLQLERA